MVEAINFNEVEQEQIILPTDISESDLRRKIVIDIGIGIFFSIVFVALNFFLPNVFTLGLPTLATAFGSFLAIAIFAPIFEELGFRGVLYSLLTHRFSPLVAGVLQAIVFTLFHFTAYGLGLSNSGAFAIPALIGAFSFGLLAWLLAKYRKNILISIIAHAVFNIWLYSQTIAFIT